MDITITIKLHIPEEKEELIKIYKDKSEAAMREAVNRVYYSEETKKEMLDIANDIKKKTLKQYIKNDLYWLGIDVFSSRLNAMVEEAEYKGEY